MGSAMNAQQQRQGDQARTTGRSKALSLIAAIPLLATPFLSAEAAIQGSPMEISVDSSSVMLSDDQQNPYIIEVSDKGVWFVVWEDWRNWRTSGADIYGRFISSDGTFCGSEMAITTASGHQTVPVSAYRDVTTSSGDKILVAWQDSRGGSTEGYIRHKDFALGSSIDCSSLSGVTAGSERAVSFNDTGMWDGSSRNDELRSRQKPSLAYDPVRDSFRLAWIESRNMQQHYSENCFNLRSISESIGDEDYVGYVGLDADTLTESTNEIGTSGADILRNDPALSLRIIGESYAAFEEVYTYEYFTEINNVAVSSDISMAETLYAWEGVSRTYELVCTCADNDDSGSCNAGDTITFATGSTVTDDGLTHIYSLPLGLIHLGSIWSERVDDGSDNPSYYPVLGLDPVHRKFLVAWEDTRDGSETKVYGQLLHSGGGHYNSNFIISYSDSDGDGVQDDNVAATRQTRPSISYDTSHQRFFVNWQDGRNTRTSLENLDIYGQFIDSEGSLRGENMPISVATGNQNNPVAAYNRDNHQFLTVWKDSRNANTDSDQDSFSDIMGQRFSLGQPQLNLVNTDDTTLVPPLFDYGVLTVGQSASQTVKLVNSGDTYVNVDCVDPYPANAPYSYAFAIPTELQTCNDGETLALVPSSEYLLGLQFAPSDTGTYIDHFTIYSDAGSPTVFLQGIANSAVATTASIVTSPDSVVDCGTVGSAETRSVNLVISNTGNTDVTVTAMDLATTGTPFTVTGISAGAIIDAKSTKYAVVRCDGASVDGAGDYTSTLRLLFDSGVDEVELTLTATISGDAVAPVSTSSSSTTSSTTSSSGSVVSTWQVYDTWEGSEVAQSDPLQVSVATDGSVTGTWGAYSFPITYSAGVGWTWSFTNGTYTWYYTITSAVGDTVSGTWQYRSGATLSETFATRAVRID